ncbi:MAG: Hsp20/alpha crystallin family protein [Proteobacteria bacterium]|nr:Hsp20/alpha crystallin family protein [Desulfobacula sp.]MBU3951920.1 Hsp20/alpha crystallin family protein [Pseudomonadota bacterium]MBU4131032.1 Hsp20/alpha crystallin family protein [Pseudomonadota bacterium]
MNQRNEIAKTEENGIKRTGNLKTAIPAVDIYENEDEIILHADMPGVVKEAVSVNVDNGTLSLSGVRTLENKGDPKWEEFGNVEFIRSFSVPQTIDVERVEAELMDGVLKLRLPKSEAAKPRQIEIKTA